MSEMQIAKCVAPSPLHARPMQLPDLSNQLPDGHGGVLQDPASVDELQGDEGRTGDLRSCIGSIHSGSTGLMLTVCCSGEGWPSYSFASLSWISARVASGDVSSKNDNEPEGFLNCSFTSPPPAASTASLELILTISEPLARGHCLSTGF
jgi:hypothetical protein